MIARNIVNEENCIKDALVNLPIKRRALQDMRSNIEELQTHIHESERRAKQINDSLEKAMEKSNTSMTQSYTTLMEVLPEKLCGICMDCNLNSPHAAITTLGCACQIRVCTPCFSLLVTELHKKPLSTHSASFLCFACQTPVPALRMAHTSFLTSLTQTPSLLNAHVNVYNQHLTAQDAMTAHALQEEEMELQSHLPLLPDSESDTENDIDSTDDTLAASPISQTNDAITAINAIVTAPATNAQTFSQDGLDEIEETELSIEDMINLLET